MNAQSLDNYITGHYGTDQFEEEEHEDYCDCSECVADREEWAAMNREYERMTR